VNEAAVHNIRHGLVAACVGDSGRFTYKKSRRGDAEIDRAAVKVLKDAGVDYEVIDFFPYGYDERQYGSPGFNLPVGCLMRTPHGRYPEYHTSGDDLSLVKAENLSVSLGIYLAVLHVLEHNRVCWSMNPKCEPQLGRRGLYDRLGGGNEGKTRQLAMLWVLNLSDGEHSLLDIAERSGLKFETVRESAEVLLEHGLLSVVTESGSRVRG
jgi:aminopeptidase-like protein